MKKSKSKSGSRSAAPAREQGPADLAAIQEQITRIVADEAVEMVRTTIGEVEKGHYLAMKYLFEMIGLWPATTPAEETEQDSLAKTLLRHLQLPEEPGAVTDVTGSLKGVHHAAMDEP